MLDSIGRLLFIILLASGSLLRAEDPLDSNLLKKLIYISDEIVTAELIEYREETLGIKNIYYGVLKIDEILSSSLKKGDMITVFWEKDPLTNVSHEKYKNVRGVWFLSSSNGVYDANKVERMQNLDTFEYVYRELNKRSTRIFIPEKIFWLNESIGATLIIRNIEDKKSSIPSISRTDDHLLLNENINLNLFPITSFSKDKTIIGKTTLVKKETTIIKEGLTEELESDQEIRTEVDLNDIFDISKPGFYSLEFFIKDYPGQLIGGFEIKTRPKVSDKMDFLKIAKDRFAPIELQKTVRVLMETVGENDPIIAWEILKKISNLSISGRDLVDVSPIAGLTNLEFLDLSNNKILDLNPIRQMRELKILDLSHNNVDDITPLRSCNSLQYLNLSYNAIVTTEPINRIINLKEIILSRNLIQEIDLSEGLKNLNYLDMSYNLIADIKPLSKLLALQKILLQGNQIKNLEPMIYSYNLELLDVRQNPIAYIDNLDGLSKPHKNVFGYEIKLDLKHDLFTEEGTPQNNSAVATDTKLPNMSDTNGLDPINEIVEEKPVEKLPSFVDEIEKNVNIVVSKTIAGKVSTILESASLVLVEFENTEDFKVDEQLVVYRADNFIGMIQIVEINPKNVVAKMVAEIKNQAGLKIEKGDLVKKSTIDK